MELQSIEEMTFDPNNFVSSKQQEADKHLLVKFFIKPKLDEAKSKKEGKPCYRDVEYIDIKVPGKRDTGVCRPARARDKARFKDHYAAFRNRMSQDITVGTPLTEWPPCSRSRAEELAYFNVKTVEQLANMADTQASQFMGIYTLRDQAKTWLEQVAKDKPLYEMKKEMDELKEVNKKLQNSLSDLLEKIEAPDPKTNSRQKSRAKSRAIDKAKEAIE